MTYLQQIQNPIQFLLSSLETFLIVGSGVLEKSDVIMVSVWFSNIFLIFL